MDALQEVILAISEQRSVDAILLQITEHLGLRLCAPMTGCPDRLLRRMRSCESG
jgi:hypothetical protein